MQQRRKELQKAENAEYVFEEMLAIAEEEKKKIVIDAIHQKSLIISEGTQLAEKKQEEILKNASQKANALLAQAQEKTAQMEKELKEWFIDGIKGITIMVVKRIVNEDVQLKNKYIEWLVHEYTTKK